MDIHVSTVTQCSGGNHRTFALTIAGVATTITIDRNDMALDFDDRGDIQKAVLDRFRSALKEANAGITLATWKTALEGKDFKV